MNKLSDFIPPTTEDLWISATFIANFYFYSKILVAEKHPEDIIAPFYLYSKFVVTSIEGL